MISLSSVIVHISFMHGSVCLIAITIFWLSHKLPDTLFFKVQNDVVQLFTSVKFLECSSTRFIYVYDFLTFLFLKTSPVSALFFIVTEKLWVTLPMFFLDFNYMVHKFDVVNVLSTGRGIVLTWSGFPEQSEVLISISMPMLFSFSCCISSHPSDLVLHALTGQYMGWYSYSNGELVKKMIALWSRILTRTFSLPVRLDEHQASVTAWRSSCTFILVDLLLCRLLTTLVQLKLFFPF